MKRKFLAIVAVLTVLLSGCSSEDDGKIHMPFGGNDYDGANYQEIVSQLEEAGFTNIREEPLGDLVTGWLNDEGEVDEVSVDGDTVFSTDSKYLPDVEIVVSYHTFPDEEESSTEDENSHLESNEESSEVENETSENTESTNEVPEENLTQVRLERFELPAYRFVACCSIQLSYSRITRKRYSRTARFRQAFFGELPRKKSLLCGKKYLFHYNIMLLSVFIFLKKDKKHSFRMRLPGDLAGAMTVGS